MSNNSKRSVMDCGDQPRFASHQEEIQYWKRIVDSSITEKEELQREFDDYTAQSQQLEKEYEAALEQNEKAIRDLESKNRKLEKERDSLKCKLEQSKHECEQLHSERDVLREEKVQYLKTIRVLEQKNDDLEQRERMILESAATYEASLNQVIEKNAILESEVEEKESLREKLQRLHDETRDLKQELHVKERLPDNDRGAALSNGGLLLCEKMDSNRLPLNKAETETQTTPIKRDASRISDPVLDRPFSPSSRVLALNIISDLMRKIGILEASLGNMTKPEYRGNSEFTRRRHISRGRSSPTIQSTLNK